MTASGARRRDPPPAAAGRTAVVSGLFGQHYSVDEGVTWQNSLGGSGPSQSVKHIGTGDDP